MVKKLLLGLLTLIVLAIVVVGVILTRAHLAIRRERAPLPADEAIVAASVAGDDFPVRLTWINTASQPMPRAVVLEPTRDPRPNDPYVMSHPAFVLEWADGHLLLVDVGMNREGAITFGKPIETFAGGQAIQPLGSTAERLGDKASRVQGAIFTHLHLDHVGGVADLCRAVKHPLHVFQTEAQAERTNHTTSSGLALLKQQQGCVEVTRLGGSPLLPVAGFPGVFVIAAGGHTPGSQLVVAFVKAADGVRRYLFTGDIVNNIDGVSHDIPKPYLYRLLLVPEDDVRQAQLRAFLRRQRDHNGFTLLVSHDQRQLEQSGVPAW